MNDFMTWDISWYHTEVAMTLITIGLLVILFSGISISVTLNSVIGFFSSIAIPLGIGIPFAISTVSHYNDRAEYYNSVLTEINENYDIILLEQRTGPNDVPSEVNSVTLLDNLDTGGYGPVTIMQDNTMLTVTAYVHLDYDNNLSVLVEDNGDTVDFNDFTETLGDEE